MATQNLRNQIFAFTPVSQIQLWALSAKGGEPEDFLFSARNLRQLLQLRYQLSGDQLRPYYDRLITILSNSLKNSEKKLFLPFLAFTKIAAYYGEAGFYSDLFLPYEIIILSAIRCNDLIVLRYFLEYCGDYLRSQRIDGIFAYEAIVSKQYQALAMLLSFKLVPEYWTILRKLDPAVIPMLVSYYERENTHDWLVRGFLSQYNKVVASGRLSLGDGHRLHEYWYGLQGRGLDKTAATRAVMTTAKFAQHKGEFIAIMLRNFEFEALNQLQNEELFFPEGWPLVITREMVANAPKISRILQDESRFRNSYDKSMYLLALQILSAANTVDAAPKGQLKGIPLTTEQVKSITELREALNLDEDEDEEKRVEHIETELENLSCIMGISIKKNPHERVDSLTLSDVVYSNAAFKYQLEHEINYYSMMNAWRIGVQIEYITEGAEGEEKVRTLDGIFSLTETSADSYGLEGAIIKGNARYSRPLNAALYRKLTKVSPEAAIRLGIGKYQISFNQMGLQIFSSKDFNLWRKYFPKELEDEFREKFTAEDLGGLGGFRLTRLRPNFNEKWDNARERVYNEFYAKIIADEEKRGGLYASLEALIV